MNRKDIAKIAAGGVAVIGMCLASSCNTTGNNTAILQPREGVKDPYALKAETPTPKEKKPKKQFNFESQQTNKTQYVPEELFAANDKKGPEFDLPPIQDKNIEIKPPTEPELELYTVQKGDTLWGIAKRASVSVDEAIHSLHAAGRRILMSRTR